MSYKHGIYGELIASTESITTTGNLPVYIGTAPMHRIASANRAINKPIIINDLDQAKEKTGYLEKDDFDEFSLSAAIYAHFSNIIESIGPIVIINVLNPANGTAVTDAEIPIVNGVGTIQDHVVIDTVTITGKTLGTDYELSYTDDGYLEITGENLESTVSISYKKVILDSITAENIIGIYNQSTEARTGIQAVADVYEELNEIPTMLAAPGYSQIPAVEKALVSMCSSISGRWEANCFTDLDSKEATSIEAAIQWKADNSYNSNYEKTCWPKGLIGTKEIWLSICTIVRKMQTDAGNDDIPYESPSNKQIDINGLIVNGNSFKISQTRANKLNANGITTAISQGGKYVLWGPHMANYEYEVTSKPEEIFDVNIFMNKYLLNDFQLRNIEIIDSPMTRNDIDALLNSEQLILNSYVSAGQLLYGKIAFNTSENPKSDLIQGDFKFNTLVTNTPPGKSITNKLQYTSAGIDTLYSGEE